MKKLDNLKIGKKLLLAFFAMIILMGIIGSTGFVGLRIVNTELQDIFMTRLPNIVHLMHVDETANHAVVAIRTMMLTDVHANEFDDLVKYYGQNLAEIEKHWALFQTYVRGNQYGTETERALADKFGMLLINWKAISRQIVDALSEGTKDGRRLAIDLSRTKGKQVFNEMHAAIESLVDINLSAAKDDDAEAAKTFRSVSAALFGIMIAGLLIAVFLSRAVSRSIERPLKEIVDRMESIAQGRLKGDVPEKERQDEIGALITSLSRVQDYLIEMSAVAEKIACGDHTVEVTPRSDEDILSYSISRAQSYLIEMSAVAEKIACGDLTVEVTPRSDTDILSCSLAKMTTNLRDQTRGIVEGVKTLASAITEISTTTTQLATSATETLTSVSEVSNTADEVKETAKMTNEKAEHVVARAEEVITISEAGMSSVKESVAGMNHVKDEMESIAEGILKLSEQTQNIGEIITAVKDLADQTNLLSVNASIEASKAGEQGKGFAVVAQEVKTLADQSKEAAEQVAAILNDIQKAASGAVLSTERGGKAVDSGMGLSSQSQNTIAALTKRVTESSDTASQIAASSYQQLVGIDQVAQAIESIKEATTQNVDASRQLESSTRNLTGLSGKLKALAEQFEV
jgi:methyl-accepting chemotaxis protein